jgi:signal transduction histidine kinase
LSGEQSKALRIAQENLKYLRDVVETASGIRQAETPRQKTNVDLNELTRHSVKLFHRVAQQNGVSLVAELPTDPILVNASPSQMINVLESLLSNAIKFSMQGGQVSVRVERMRAEGLQCAHISVKDTGIGIDPKHLPYIFDQSFSTERPDLPRFGGLGIGVSLANDIVQAHGGKMWAESQPNQGAVFHFTIPSSS